MDNFQHSEGTVLFMTPERIEVAQHLLTTFGIRLDPKTVN